MENERGSSEKIEIFLVEDDRAAARYAALMLTECGYNVTVAYSAAEAASVLELRHFPLVVSDLYLGEETGLSLIPFTKKHGRPSFIIFLTGQGGIATTVQAIHEGAFAYLSKPRDLEDLEATLIPVIQRALKKIEVLESKSEVATPLLGLPTASRMIGRAPAMIGIYQSIAKASLSRGNVIILGESGTGKELVAHAIHENSRWATKPFVTVNCSALAETLLESELFGHVKGAFTGAISNKKGLFEEANGGTLFLDEIGDVSPALQVKLLRAIQEGEIRSVGASESRQVDVRIIAATHRNLGACVKEGKFREDLYYRLKVFLIEVPPLRERLDDLQDLVHSLVDRAVQKNRLSPISVSGEAMALLTEYSWPGNIRELENAIERAVATSSTNVLFPDDFPSEISSLAKSDVVGSLPVTNHSRELDESLDKLEREHIVRVLERANFNKSKTAERLGIDRGTLYRKALRHSIPLDDTNGEQGESSP